MTARGDVGNDSVLVDWILCRVICHYVSDHVGDAGSSSIVVEHG